jgi:sirohydrochlorin cobaltochelatase
VTTPLPLLLVGHGTRSSAGVAEFGRLAGRVRARARAAWRVPAVEAGFIELAAPSVAGAVARLVRAGHLEAAAVPLVLTAAGHGKGDIPAALARERARHPGLRVRYGRPLGPHPVLQDLLAARIESALAGADRRRTHIVLAGRGSTDPDANAEVEPSVPAVLDKVRRLGARRVVVAPYFLFPGVLPDRVTAQSREFAADHTAIDVRVAGLIGDCDELADLALERYHEAVHGDIRMNCDTCAYRVALPGFADKVGRPQAPHCHPDDLSPHHGDPAHGEHVHPETAAALGGSLREVLP